MFQKNRVDVAVAYAVVSVVLAALVCAGRPAFPSLVGILAEVTCGVGVTAVDELQPPLNEVQDIPAI